MASETRVVAPSGSAGADDNAAAVAIVLEVEKQLAARRPRGRGVIFASFDGEEPPYVRHSCELPTSLRFQSDARDDAATLRSILALTRELAPYAPQVQAARSIAEGLLRSCDRTGRLPSDLQPHVAALLLGLEQALA